MAKRRNRFCVSEEYKVTLRHASGGVSNTWRYETKKHALEQARRATRTAGKTATVEKLCHRGGGTRHPTREWICEARKGRCSKRRK